MERRRRRGRAGTEDVKRKKKFSTNLINN